MVHKVRDQTRYSTRLDPLRPPPFTAPALTRALAAAGAERLLLFVPAHALLAIRPGSVVAHRVQFSRSIDASRTRPLRRSTVRASALDTARAGAVIAACSSAAVTGQDGWTEAGLTTQLSADCCSDGVGPCTVDYSVVCQDPSAYTPDASTIISGCEAGSSVCDADGYWRCAARRRRAGTSQASRVSDKMHFRPCSLPINRGVYVPSSNRAKS